ncbi:Maf family protein [Micrococcus luteus]|uniref:Maf family protein n=1 Tax=Micrococcus luteus TaxID=1270 RepID=UPI003879CD3C
MIPHDDGAAGPGAGLRLVLGSASPGRAEVLTRARVPFRVVVSGVDEAAVGAAAGDPSPAELAEAKGRDVAARVAAAGVEAPTLVLGCDSVFEFEGRAHGKPHEPEVAVERWRAQAGREGVLHSGHWLGLVLPEPGAGSGVAAEAGVVSAVVRFGAVTEAEIQAYVATGEPLHCAGAFTVDGAGAALVDGVDGDPNAVIGLSVAWLRRATAALGQDFTRLWEPSNAQR